MPDYFIDTPTVAGQTGSLHTYLARVLCVGEVIRETSGPAYTDHSAEARLEGGTPFDLLAATTDRVYIGYDARFTEIDVDLAVAGAGVTLVVEYWDGGAWVAVSSLVDGSSHLSADGYLSWADPGSGWTKNSINGGPSMFHIRLTTSSGPSTTPTANHLVVLWTLYDDAAGTNEKVYRARGEDKASDFYLWVHDNGTAYTDAKNGAFRLYEAWNATTHTGTNATPTAAQVSAGIALRKSNTANATARTVLALVNRDRIILAVYSGDTASQAFLYHAGGLSSYVTSDAYRGFVIGETATPTASRFGEQSAFNATLTGHYLQRTYGGTGTSIQVGKTSLLGASTQPTSALLAPNGPDSGLHQQKFVIHEATTAAVFRGELVNVRGVLNRRGGSYADADTYTLDGARYRLVAWRDNSGSGGWGFLALRNDLGQA